MPAPYRVLILCTGNACRSQMGEALLRHHGGDRFVAHSAGSNYAGYIHPIAIQTMARMGIPMDGQFSKSWSRFGDTEFDIIITVCDSAAHEPCPNWPGRPATAHWGLPDPSFHPGPEEERLEYAESVARRLERYIQQMIALPLDDLTPEQLKDELERIYNT